MIEIKEEIDSDKADDLTENAENTDTFYT